MLRCRDEELSKIGFVRDYRDLDKFKRWLNTNHDHHDLNSRLDCNPTAENIAKAIFDVWSGQFPELHSVGVSETPKTMAWYVDE